MHIVTRRFPFTRWVHLSGDTVSRCSRIRTVSEFDRSDSRRPADRQLHHLDEDLWPRSDPLCNCRAVLGDFDCVLLGGPDCESHRLVGVIGQRLN